jgi:hypothetical protein
MDNGQKHNNYINISSSQISTSYFVFGMNSNAIALNEFVLFLYVTFA